MSLKTTKINKTLLHLMKTNKFSDITVAEICAWSDVSRGTFYNHFKSKEDVISAISRDLILNILDNFSSGKDDWIADLAYYFFEQSKSYCDYLSLLSEQNLFHLHRNELLDAFYHHKSVVKQQLYLNMDERFRTYVILSYTSSGLAIYEEWAKNGFEETADEITQIFLKIIPTVHDS